MLNVNHLTWLRPVPMWMPLKHNVALFVSHSHHIQLHWTKRNGTKLSHLKSKSWRNWKTKYILSRLLTQRRTKCSSTSFEHFTQVSTMTRLYFAPRITSHLRQHQNFHRVTNQLKICDMVNRNSPADAIKTDITHKRDSAALPAGTLWENSPL